MYFNRYLKYIEINKSLGRVKGTHVKVRSLAVISKFNSKLSVLSHTQIIPMPKFSYGKNPGLDKNWGMTRENIYKLRLAYRSLPSVAKVNILSAV
jgi:hypothetical protein